MSKLLKKVFLPLSLALVTACLGCLQRTHAQASSVGDSVQHLLTWFHKNAKDEKLKGAIKEAQVAYGSKTINDSLAKKLLTVDSILIVGMQPDPQRIFSYAKMLTGLLQQLSPKEEHPDYIQSINYMALLYQNMGQYEDALPLLEQVLAIRKKVSGTEHPDYANGLNNLGVLYYYMGQYEKALPLLEQTKAIRKKALGEEHPDYATSLNDLSVLLQDMGQNEKALSLLEQAIAIRKKVLGDEHTDYALSLNNLAELYRSMGQPDKALPLFEKTTVIIKKSLGEEHPYYAISLNNLAGLYNAMGQHEKALHLYVKAIAIRKKTLGEEHPDYAISLNNLAELYKDMGWFEKALPLHEQAVSVVKKALGEKHPGYANRLNNLAVLYQVMGQYEKTLPLLEQAKAIYKQALGEEHHLYAQSLNNLAASFKYMGQPQKALPLMEQAVALDRKASGEEHPGYATGLNNLALIYQDMGKNEKALPLLEQAKAIYNKVLGEEHPLYALSLNNLALLHQDMGRFEKALPLLEQAKAINNKVLGEEHPDHAAGLHNLAILYQVMGKNEKTLPLLTNASTLTLRYLNRTYTALSEQEKMNLQSKESSRFNHLPSLLFTQNIHSPAFLQQIYSHELALKGMVLENQKTVLNNIRKSNDTAALELYEKWYDNKVFLGKQLLLPIKKRIAGLDSLEEVNNQLEQQLSRRSASFNSRQQQQRLSAKNVAQKLREGEAAIEFISFKVYNRKWTDSTIYAALLLFPGDTATYFQPLFEEKQLQQLLQSSATATTYTAVEHLYGKKKPANANVSGSLYQLIWKPLEKYLKDVQTVYYAPAGLLHRISFQALPADSTHLLIDKHQLHQLLSTRSLALPTETAPKPRSAQIWGNITYSISYNSDNNSIASNKKNTRSPDAANTAISAFNLYTPDTKETRTAGIIWRPLLSTKAEMDSLKKIFNGAGITFISLTGTAATEESFKALSGKSPQVLHVATHGFFLPVKTSKPKDNDLSGGSAFTVQQNPMFRSGLVLAGGNTAWKGEATIAGKEDGILTAYEIAQMDLSNTDLVVLSACETALGDVKGNEGVIGLQRALKMAGVKQMIISLWQVPDKATMQLMTAFYNNWLGGRPAREALRMAQLQLKEKYKHPYFWAAFVLVE